MALALHVEERGRGAPLVLLHGWGTNLHVFDALLEQLEGPGSPAAAHRIIAVDLPGHGASPWDAAAGGGAALCGLPEALEPLVPPGATLVGWSLGGQLALALAARAQLAVRRLVLIASTPRFAQAAQWPWGLAPAVLQQFAAALQRQPAQTLEAFFELAVRGDRHADAAAAALQAALARHGRPHPEALAAGLALLVGNDLRELAAAVRVPALLICGRHDRVTPAGASHALARQLPRARVLELPRAGHALLLSHAAQLATALGSFLAEPAP